MRRSSQRTTGCTWPEFLFSVPILAVLLDRLSADSVTRTHISVIVGYVILKFDLVAQHSTVSQTTRSLILSSFHNLLYGFIY